MKRNHFILAGLILSWYFSCKPEVIDEPVPSSPVNLVVEATVPAKVWDNTARIYLDASRTNTLNGRRQLNYFWSLVKMPSGASVNTLRLADKPVAQLESPYVLGVYEIELLVEDKNDLKTRSKAYYRLEILADTLHLYPPQAHAGHDTTITAPDNMVILNGLRTYYINPIGRSQKFSWSVVSQPASSPVVNFQASDRLISEVYDLSEGVYQFSLEVRDELERKAYDTVQVTVLPDPLKGTLKLFTDLEWQKVEIVEFGWGPYTQVVLYVSDPSLSMKRTPYNTEVRVWIDSLNTWSTPNAYEWYVEQDRLMSVYYPHSDDEKTYLKDVGKKTKVEVRFK